MRIPVEIIFFQHLNRLGHRLSLDQHRTQYRTFYIYSLRWNTLRGMFFRGHLLLHKGIEITQCKMKRKTEKFKMR